MESDVAHVVDEVKFAELEYGVSSIRNRRIKRLRRSAESSKVKVSVSTL